MFPPPPPSSIMGGYHGAPYDHDHYQQMIINQYGPSPPVEMPGSQSIDHPFQMQHGPPPPPSMRHNLSFSTQSGYGIYQHRPKLQQQQSHPIIFGKNPPQMPYITSSKNNHKQPSYRYSDTYNRISLKSNNSAFSIKGKTLELLGPNIAHNQSNNSKIRLQSWDAQLSYEG